MPDAYSTNPAHDISADKRKRLEDFYNNYKDDGGRSSRNAPIEVELAYQILSDSGKENPLYFKKLIREVIDVMHKTVQNESAAISEIYTLINMDSRFQHIGDGVWGLTDWYPPSKKSSSKSASRTVKSAS